MRVTYRLTLDVTYDLPDVDLGDDEIWNDIHHDIRSQLLDLGSAAQIRGMMDTDDAEAIIVVPGLEELR